jgi:hypothetical protein
MKRKLLAQQSSQLWNIESQHIIDNRIDWYLRTLALDFFIRTSLWSYPPNSKNTLYGFFEKYMHWFRYLSSEINSCLTSGPSSSTESLPAYSCCRLPWNSKLRCHIQLSISKCSLSTSWLVEMRNYKKVAWWGHQMLEEIYQHLALVQYFERLKPSSILYSYPKS